MAFSLTLFQNNATNQLSAMDNNFATVSAQAPIPCSVTGTNSLALTQNSAGLVPSSVITAFLQNMLFTGVASATNTGNVVASVSGVGPLEVYKDSPSGPALLTGNEIIAKNAFSLLYDAALNSGAGGFHLIASTAVTQTAIAPSSVQINNNSIITNLLSGTVSLLFTATPGWSSQDQTFTLTGLPPQVPAPGDLVQINPPSLPNAGVAMWGMVTALGSLSSVASVATVNVRLVNSASASLASNSGIYRWSAMRVTP
jgi:hypothetical protein